MTTKNSSQILLSLQAVNNEISEIKKDQSGHGYKFRGINQVLNTLSPLFKKHNILTKRRNVQISRSVRNALDKYGKEKSVVETFISKCDYVFISTVDGSEFVTEGFGEGIDQSGGDKSSAMAISNSYKYVIFEMFNIATEEQKDSDQVTAEEAKKDSKPLNIVDNRPPQLNSGFRKKGAVNATIQAQEEDSGEDDF